MNDLKMRFRTGQRVGRTIYLHVQGDTELDGTLVGVMDTRRLAQLAVDAMNARLEADGKLWRE